MLRGDSVVAMRCPAPRGMGRGVAGRECPVLADPRADGGWDCDRVGLRECSVTTVSEESGMRPRTGAEFAAAPTIAAATGCLIVGALMTTSCCCWGCNNSSDDSLVLARESELRSTDDSVVTPGMPNSAVPSLLVDSEVSTISPVLPTGRYG